MRFMKVFALLVVASMALGACGDDDSGETATGSTAGEETAGEETAGDETPGDGDDTGVDEDALAEGMGECGFLAGFATAFEDFEPPGVGGTGETDFGAMFAPLADAAEDVADAAPSEIRDAFETVAEGFRTAADELEGVVLDLSDPENVDPEAMARLEELESSFSPDFEAAGEEIDAWIQDNCGDLADAFDLDAFGS